MSIRDNFGQARTKGPSYKNFKPDVAKPFTFRLFPPMKSFQATGAWFTYGRQHWGYRTTDSQDPNKTKPRTFMCIEEKDRVKDMITVSCPECRLIEQKTQFLLDREATESAGCKARGILSEPEIEREIGHLLQPTRDWLKAHSLDKKYAYLVMDLAGEFGVLRLGYRAHKQLVKLIDGLKAEGIDAFDFDTGVFFTVTRDGNGRETEYTVVVTKEPVMIDGRKLMDYKRAPLTDAQLEQAVNMLPDLGTLFANSKLSAEQIRLLVEGDGDPSEVDAIFGMTQRRERSPAPAPAPTQAAAPKQPAPQAQPQVQTQPQVQPQAQAPVQRPVDVPDDLQAQIVALQAKLAKQTAMAQPAAPAQVVGPVVAPVPSPAVTEALNPNVAASNFLSKFQKKSEQ